MISLGTLWLHSKCPPQFSLQCTWSYPLITFETHQKNIVITSAKCSQCAQQSHIEHIQNVLQNVTLMFLLGTLELHSKCPQQFSLPCALSYPLITFGTSAEHCDSICKVFTMCPVVTC